VDAFTLTSPDVTNGGQINLAYVYGPDAPGGGNQSPALSWSGFPTGTKSFAVSCFDPDAPTPSGFWHWSVVDLPGDTTSLDRGAGNPGGALPGTAFHVANDFGTVGYDGPAPPPGDQVHRYFFVVHAVDAASLGVDGNTSATAVSFNLVFHTLARAIIVPEFAY
jgi:Raf kinase inhibitor-like YbhB/YbcL family protein